MNIANLKFVLPCVGVDAGRYPVHAARVEKGGTLIATDSRIMAVFKPVREDETIERDALIPAKAIPATRKAKGSVATFSVNGNIAFNVDGIETLIPKDREIVGDFPDHNRIMPQEGRGYESLGSFDPERLILALKCFVAFHDGARSPCVEILHKDNSSLMELRSTRDGVGELRVIIMPITTN